MHTQCPYLNVWWIQIQNPSCSSFKLNCVDVDVSLKYRGAWQCFFLPPSAHLSLLSLFWGKTFSFSFSLCREDVWVPWSLTDIYCSQIQIGPIKHSRQKTALIKDSQQSFNVNFLLFLTDSGTLKCPWRPWNLKYIGANFNIVALAWVCAELHFGPFIVTRHRALKIFLKPQKYLFPFMLSSHSSPLYSWRWLQLQGYQFYWWRSTC